MLLVLALLAIGTGLTRPPLFGLLSNLAPPNEPRRHHRRGAKCRSLGAHSRRRCSPRPLHPTSHRCRDVTCGVISILAGILAMQRLGKR